jgi:hypothetical protein
MVGITLKNKKFNPRPMFLPTTLIELFQFPIKFIPQITLCDIQIYQFMDLMLNHVSGHKDNRVYLPTIRFTMCLGLHSK